MMLVGLYVTGTSTYTTPLSDASVCRVIGAVSLIIVHLLTCILISSYALKLPHSTVFSSFMVISY